jgi:hypothetical protein
MELTQEDAQVVATALIQYNNVILSEYEKLMLAGEDVSQFLKDAAYQEYQRRSEEVTKFHTKLAQAFPKLMSGILDA